MVIKIKVVVVGRGKCDKETDFYFCCTTKAGAAATGATAKVKTKHGIYKIIIMFKSVLFTDK